MGEGTTLSAVLDERRKQSSTLGEPWIDEGSTVLPLGSPRLLKKAALSSRSSSLKGGVTLCSWRDLDRSGRNLSAFREP